MQDEEIKNHNQEDKPRDSADDWQKKAQEYLDGWKRAQADLINYRKDEAKRLAEFAKFANESLIIELLDVLDDLQKALEHASGPDGLGQIVKKFEDLLTKHGVEKISTASEFDPLLHEAVGGDPDGDGLEEIRAGYTMNGKVIRPARVMKVSSEKQEERSKGKTLINN